MACISRIIVLLFVLGITPSCAEEINLLTLTPALNATGIHKYINDDPQQGVALDLGGQKPPLEPHFALNVDGASPPNVKAWAALSDAALYGDGTYSVSFLENEINGEQCGGPLMLATTNGKALMALVCEGKNTDTIRLGTVDLVSGAVAWIANRYLSPNLINTYGGSDPPPNCDHNRDQLDWHMYCQWIRTHAQLITNPDNTITVTITASLHGSGGLDDPSRNDPTAAVYQIGQPLVWSGPRPSGIAIAGKTGIASVVTQGVMENSFFSPLIAEAIGEPPPIDCSSCPPECLQ